MAFTNPARKDGLLIYHWRRAAVEGKEYAFARSETDAFLAHYHTFFLDCCSGSRTKFINFYRNAPTLNTIGSAGFEFSLYHLLPDKRYYPLGRSTSNCSDHYTMAPLASRSYLHTCHTEAKSFATYILEAHVSKFGRSSVTIEKSQVLQSTSRGKKKKKALF